MSSQQETTDKKHKCKLTIIDREAIVQKKFHHDTVKAQLVLSLETDVNGKVDDVYVGDPVPSATISFWSEDVALYTAKVFAEAMENPNFDVDVSFATHYAEEFSWRELTLLLITEPGCISTMVKNSNYSQSVEYADEHLEGVFTGFTAFQLVVLAYHAYIKKGGKGRPENAIPLMMFEGFADNVDWTNCDESPVDFESMTFVDFEEAPALVVDSVSADSAENPKKREREEGGESSESLPTAKRVTFA